MANRREDSSDDGLCISPSSSAIAPQVKAGSREEVV